MRLMNIQGIAPKRSKRAWIIVLLAIALGGCSAGGLMVRYFYSQVDNTLYQRITGYASFNEEQKKEIRQAVDHFVKWHRTAELPKYVEFLGDLSEAIEAGRLDQDIALGYLNHARGLTARSFQQSPLFNPNGFIQSLTDQQVIEIRQSFRLADEKFKSWYEERKSAGATQTRLEAIVKNIKRVGIVLNEEQKQILERGLQRYQGDSLERHAVFRQWRMQLVEILLRRQDSQALLEYDQHMLKYQDLAKNHNPAQFKANQIVTANLLTDIVASLDPRQKQKLLKRLRQTQTALSNIHENRIL